MLRLLRDRELIPQERIDLLLSHDVLWLAASVLLAGVWIVVFAVAVLGLLDREVSASLARALGMS